MLSGDELRAIMILLALVLSAASVSACIVYGGGVVYLNKPNVTVNLSAITESNATQGENYTLSNNTLFFRSHHNDTLLASLGRDEYGWVLRIGLPNASAYEQPREINWSEAVWTELDWLWAHKVINGTTPGDVSQIVGLLANSTGSYIYWKDGNWTAIQSNCFPNGNCVRCGPAGAGLNESMPPYGLDVPEKTDDEKAEACLAGFILLLLPLLIARRI